MKLILHAVALIAMTSVASAQSLSNLFSPALNRNTVDLKTTNLGDLNGDGHEDFGLAARAQSGERRGAVISGVDGSVLFEVHGTALWASQFPAGAAAVHLIVEFFRLGDVDGDGVNDYAYVRDEIVQNAVFFAPADVVVRSGASHALIGTLPLIGTTYCDDVNFPIVVSSLGDQNSDGFAEIGVSAHGSVGTTFNRTDYSFVDSFDGATLARSNLQLYPWDLAPGGLVLVQDIDGDFIDDYVVSSGNTNINAAGEGSLSAYSGLTSAPIWHRLGGTIAEQLGKRTIGLDDINGDGVRELAIFVAGADVVTVDSGAVEICSGANGAPLHQVVPALGDLITDVSEAADLDGDGYRDFLVRMRTTGTLTNWIEARSGFDGSFLRVFNERSAAVGDTNGDGIGEVATLIPTSSAINTSSVVLDTLMGTAAYGASTGAFDYHWLPGNPAPANGAIELTGAAPFAALVGIVSFTPANGLVPGTGLPLYVSGAPNDLYGLFYASADAIGAHLDPMNLAEPAIAGIKIYIQYGIFGAAGGMSNAVEVLFGL